MIPSLDYLSSTRSKRSTSLIVQGMSQLTDQLHLCTQEEFTGQLVLKLEGKQSFSWRLYYEMGHLIWGTGGNHAIRRWYRHLSQQRSGLPGIGEAAEINVQPWDYDGLIALQMQGKIQQTDVEAIAQGLILELFFDLYQHWAQCCYSSLQTRLNYVQHLDPGHLDPTQPDKVHLRIDETWAQALQDWKIWQQAGLQSYSPNQSPFISDAQALQQQVLPHTYQFLITLMDGRQTLRDLALKSNKSLLALTKSLIPYIQYGWITLLEVGDLQPAIVPEVRPLTKPLTVSPAPTPPRPVQVQPPAPLIAYIDDYQEDGQKMNRLLTQLGYRCLVIQDPIQALPLLLEHKPGLIFLDLVMPVINGYEACAQIRRISRFKETPIVILTSSDGIVDRVRAKIVGSTDFLAKPIQARKVQAVLQKYLENLENSRNLGKSTYPSPNPLNSFPLWD